MVTASNSLKERVNLFVSGRKLKNLDTFSKSDPKCLLFEELDGKWRKIGETERINNSLNPDFQTSFTVDYYFEKKQTFRFEFIDSDNSGDSDYDKIGSIEVVMGKLMGAPKQVWEERLYHKGSERGKIIVRTQTISGASSNIDAVFSLEYNNVNNMDGCCAAMCVRYQEYVFQLQKQVPGDPNRFVIV